MTNKAASPNAAFTLSPIKQNKMSQTITGEPISKTEKLVQQIQGIKNLIKFKEALYKLTGDEIEALNKDIVFLQGMAEENAIIVSKDEIENKAAGNGQH